MNSDVCGIYYILNIINKKIYIGSSHHINRRFYEHKYFLDRNIHSNKHLQSAWNSYGEDNFEFGIIELIDLKYDDLLEIEQIWMDYFNSYNDKNGYNISAYADGSGGYQVSDITKDKIRKWHIGRKASNDTKQKMSEQRTGINNNFYGKKHTKETKNLIRKSKLGKQLSPEHKEKISNNLFHGQWDEEHLELFRKQRIGEKSPTAKLKESDVIAILTMIQNGIKYTDIKQKYKISDTEISRIRHKKRWDYLYEKYPELYS